MREHLAPFQNNAFHDAIIKHNFNFYHLSCGTGKNIIWSNACCSKEEWQVTAKVSKLFSKLVFSIDFSAFAVCVEFFRQKYCLSHGIWILVRKSNKLGNKWKIVLFGG